MTVRAERTPRTDFPTLDSGRFYSKLSMGSINVFVLNPVTSLVLDVEFLYENILKLNFRLRMI